MLGKSKEKSEMNIEQVELTKDQAVAFYESRTWEQMDYVSRAKFQMLQPLLCMPFTVFHEAMEKALGRPVWTHEFGLNHSGLKQELFQGTPSPSMQDIINLIPEDKRVVIFT
jgi:hypothetical protein